MKPIDRPLFMKCDVEDKTITDNKLLKEKLNSLFVERM